VANNKKKKSKRNREWKADDDEHLKKVPKYESIVPATNQITKADFDALAKWLYQWTRDMHSWGQDVRDDIIRLESAAGIAQGDPGDPPGGPPD